MRPRQKKWAEVLLPVDRAVSGALGHSRRNVACPSEARTELTTEIASGLYVPSTYVILPAHISNPNFSEPASVSEGAAAASSREVLRAGAEGGRKVSGEEGRTRKRRRMQDTYMTKGI